MERLSSYSFPAEATQTCRVLPWLNASFAEIEFCKKKKSALNNTGLTQAPLLSRSRSIIFHRCRINQTNNSSSITMFVDMSFQQPSTSCGLTTTSTTFPAIAIYLKEKFFSCTSYDTPPHELHQIMICGHSNTNDFRKFHLKKCSIIWLLKRKGYSLSPLLPHMIKSAITMCRNPCIFNLQPLVDAYAQKVQKFE